MTTRTFALVFGAVYLLVGVLGFVPGLLMAPPADAPGLAADQNYGYLLGLFPVNLLHSIVHVLLGIWGLAAYASFGAAHTYAVGLAIIYGLLAVMGVIPGLWSTFGLIPLWGHDVWLHAGTAAIAAYFAWGVRETARPMHA